MGKYYVRKYLKQDYSEAVNNAILMSGIKKKKISEITGIKYQTLSYKLHGRVAWCMDDLAAIAEALDISVAELIGEEVNV